MTRPRALVCLVAIALFACHARPPQRRAHPFLGRAGAIRPADLARALAFARDVFSGRDASFPDHTRGSRVFLTAFDHGGRATIASGLGVELRESITLAAHELRARVDAPSSVRLQLDLVTSFAREARPCEGKGYRVGVIGFVVPAPATHGFSFVLPSEVITRGLTAEGFPTLDRARCMQALFALGEPSAELGRDTASFTTASLLEPSVAGAAPIPLVRAMPAIESPIDAAFLRTRAGLAADYLVRAIDDRGQFSYVYEPRADRASGLEPAEYDFIRHAGSVESIFVAARVLSEPRYLEQAERALAHLEAALSTEGDVSYLDGETDGGATIGGTGLALLAFVEHARSTGSTDHVERMHAMARFLGRQQDHDGRFIGYTRAAGGEGAAAMFLYYPGEAMLSLVRLHALDGDARWLAAARAAADYRLAHPESYADDYDRDSDYWLVVALVELHRLTGTPAYAERAFAIVRATMESQKHAVDVHVRDYAGTFQRYPRSTPASVRLEAYGHALALAERLHDQPLARAIREHASEVARFIASQQFTAEAAYALPNPARAIGGVRASPWDDRVRIDYDQHALVAWLAFADALSGAEPSR